MDEIIKRQYFVLIFEDMAGELHAYDTKFPASCLKAVTEKHLEFEFVHIIAETSDASVRSLCAVIRQARQIRTRIAEDKARRLSAPPALPAPSPSASARPVL